MKWYLGIAGAAVWLLALVAGCRDGMRPEEVANPVFEIPEVPGADEPYPMPELGPPPERTEDPLSPR